MTDPEKKENVKGDESATEWPHNPPLPPREVDPTGEGDELRKVAAPGDDIVFEANAELGEAKKRSDEAKKKDAERPQPER